MTIIRTKQHSSWKQWEKKRNGERKTQKILKIKTIHKKDKIRSLRESAITEHLSQPCSQTFKERSQKKEERKKKEGKGERKKERDKERKIKRKKKRKLLSMMTSQLVSVSAM